MLAAHIVSGLGPQAKRYSQGVSMQTIHFHGHMTPNSATISLQRMFDTLKKTCKQLKKFHEKTHLKAAALKFGPNNVF